MIVRAIRLKNNGSTRSICKNNEDGTSFAEIMCGKRRKTEKKIPAAGVEPAAGNYDAVLLYTSFLPIRTPMTDAIIRPRVHPEESPRQYRPTMDVRKSVSILTRLE